MQRFVVTCALLLAGAAAAGCGPDPEVVAEKEREVQWQLIEETRSELTAKREQLAAAEAAAAAAAAGEGGAKTAAGEAGAETAAAAAAAGAEVTRLEQEAGEVAERLNQQLVDFINANPPVAGETPPERVRQAIRMKSDEDIRIAREYIDEGGDYRRALDIYDAAQAVDPDYEELKRLRAEAEALRFMTEERFAQVEEGMTRDQVRAVLGQVNLRNIRDYPEKNAVAWFYPRDDRGSAAAVWFNQDRRGEYVVYEADFHFKDAGEEEAAGG
jgi:hypothetical protein